MGTPKIISDSPVSQKDKDCFEFCDYADVIAKTILSADSANDAIFGVLGGWGTGKTSLMRLIQSKLAEAKDGKDLEVYHTWFDTWRYANENNISALLVQHLLNGCKTVKNTEFKTALTGLAQAMWASVYGLQVEVGPFIKYSPKEAQEKAEKLMHDTPDATLKFYQAIDDLQQAAQTLDKERIVVFVDDLDRLLPTQALGVLEHIKLTLTWKNIIFVLALDEKAIEKAVREKYGENSPLTGTEYVKKIIQVPVYVPKPNKTHIQRYVGQCSTHLPEIYSAAFQKAITGMGLANPREIKRLINKFSLRAALNFQDHVSQRDMAQISQAFVVWQILELDQQYAGLLSNMRVLDESLDQAKRNIINQLLSQPKPFTVQYEQLIAGANKELASQISNAFGGEKAMKSHANILIENMLFILANHMSQSFM